jgi:DNA primase
LSDDRVKLVKQANDIVDVVGSYVTLRPAGGTFKGLCPFHDDSRPSFDVCPKRQRYRCWACGKFGDVISFVQEVEKASFRDALELLARRANIDLGPQASADSQGRARLLDVLRWAAQQYAGFLLDSPAPEAEAARRYLGERKLLGETVRQWGLGYAPASGTWLLGQAERDHVPLDLLETVGLIAQRSEGIGWYDRFRARVQFPIRDLRGQVVGFGGRILPGSPLESRAPKYYNSAETALFSKSENLYGIDRARDAAAQAGFLAVMEGYTDVLMSHQHGIANVVATMGTALNERHVRQLRRLVPRVVLVFDADEGGGRGVDRALELFVSQEMELAVAALPSGLDPCDLLVKEGPGPMRRALESAVDALEFKLTQSLAREDTTGVEGRRRVVDSVLGVLSLAPAARGEAAAIKMQLIVGRISRRLGVSEQTLWSRLDELRRQRRSQEPPPSQEPRSGPAAPEERELLQVLLAEPSLVARAAAEVTPEEVGHPGLRSLLQGLYGQLAQGREPTLDGMRDEVASPALLSKAFELQEVGLDHEARDAWLSGLLAHFRSKRERDERSRLRDQLRSVDGYEQSLEVLRRLQERTAESNPDQGSPSGEPSIRT